MPRSQIWDGSQWVDMAGGDDGSGDYLPLTGGTLTGPLMLAADPTADLEAATKIYVDTHGGGGGIPEAPEDGVLYGRQDATWAAVPSSYLPLTGGTLTGDQPLASPLVRNITASDTAPTSPTPNVGDVWIDTSGS